MQSMVVILLKVQQGKLHLTMMINMISRNYVIFLYIYYHFPTVVEDEIVLSLSFIVSVLILDPAVQVGAQWPRTLYVVFLGKTLKVAQNSFQHLDFDGLL